MVLKVLFAGYKNPNYRAVTDFIEAGLVELGHDVRFFDYRGFVLPGRARDRFPALERWDRARLNRRLRALARDYRPHLLLVNGGHTLEPETIRAVRETGAKTALWTSDYPLLIDVYVKLAPHYDRYFLSGTDVVEHHRRAGNPDGIFLPFACLPDLHKPVELDDADRRRYRCDVFFAGTAYPERVALLTALAGLGVELAIWGPGFEALPEGHPLRRRVRGSALSTEGFVKAASGCKLAFNFMGNPMAPQMEELCNSRVFELLGCGACQLVDAKGDVRKLFQNGRELLWFENEAQLLELTRRWLSDDEGRRALGRRAREAALAQHTYRHRLTELIRACGLSDDRR